MDKAGSKILIVGAALLAVFLVLRNLEDDTELPPPTPAPFQAPAPAPAPVGAVPAMPTAGEVLGRFAPPPVASVPPPESSAPPPPAAPAVAPSIRPCVENVDYGKLAARLKKARFDPRNIVDEVHAYHVCRALAGEGLEACLAFDRWHRAALKTPSDGFCEDDVVDYRISFAAIRGDAAFEDSCLPPLKKSGLFRSPRRACALYASIYRERRLGNACQQLAGLLKSGRSRTEFLKKCVLNVSSIFGEKACVKIKDEAGRRLCVAEARAMQARAAGDTNACGDSGLCRVGLGDPVDACDVYKTAAVVAYCAAAEVDVNLSKEIAFRAGNGLPKYKKGDPFLHGLPPDELERMLKKKGLRRPSAPRPRKSRTYEDWAPPPPPK